MSDLNISKKAIKIALHELDHGFGEQDRDNSGPDVAKYFGQEWEPLKVYGNWCAAFWSWCLELAGVKLTPRQRRGARALVRAIADRGSWVYRPSLRGPIKIGDPRPGDTIAWNRGDPMSWEKHVGGIEKYEPSTDLLITLEGNAGKFPCKVIRKIYPDGRWRRNLYGISRLDV